MRPKLEKLGNIAILHSFTCSRVQVPFFEFYWHFHPEFELTFIVKGKGSRIVGNSIEPFETGDFVLLGPNLPHVWVSDEQETGPCEAIVIQFPESFMQNLLRFPEWNGLHDMVTHAGRGLAFSGVSNMQKEPFKVQMQQIAESHNIHQLIKLLLQLSDLKRFPLSSDSFSTQKPPKDTTRINAALHFIQMHYLQPINIKRAAESIHLSESAFSKFFIREMGISFTTYLNELRIAHATRLLLETDKSISNIAFDSGFENLSYFNRVFLHLKRITPMKFRKIKQRR